MVKALNAFQSDRLTFNKNQHEWDDKEVVNNHRYLKKEISEMNEVMERMARVIVNQNETNQKLEKKVLDVSKEVKELNVEIDQQSDNFDKVLHLLGQEDNISDPQDGLSNICNVIKTNIQEESSSETYHYKHLNTNLAAPKEIYSIYKSPFY